MKLKLREKYWRDFFVVGIIFKTMTGLAETVSGLVLLVIRPETLAKILMRLSGGGQPQDADDWILFYAYDFLEHLTTGTKIFAGLYILLHGVINLVLALGLIKEKLWAYLVAIGVLVSFMLYQISRIAFNHSIFLTVLTCLDALFVVVIWHEYRYQVKRLSKLGDMELVKEEFLK